MSNKIAAREASEIRRMARAITETFTEKDREQFEDVLGKTSIDDLIRAIEEPFWECGSEVYAVQSRFVRAILAVALRRTSESSLFS